MWRQRLIKGAWIVVEWVKLASIDVLKRRSVYFMWLEVKSFDDHIQ